MHARLLFLPRFIHMQTERRREGERARTEQKKCTHSKRTYFSATAIHHRLEWRARERARQRTRKDFHFTVYVEMHAKRCDNCQSQQQNGAANHKKNAKKKKIRENISLTMRASGNVAVRKRNRADYNCLSYLNNVFNELFSSCNVRRVLACAGHGSQKRCVACR